MECFVNKVKMEEILTIPPVWSSVIHEALEVAAWRNAHFRLKGTTFLLILAVSVKWWRDNSGWFSASFWSTYTLECIYKSSSWQRIEKLKCSSFTSHPFPFSSPSSFLVFSSLLFLLSTSFIPLSPFPLFFLPICLLRS